MILTESKMQNWRAVAINRDGGEHLLYVGPSSDQVRKSYVGSFYDLLTDDEQQNIYRIVLERWYGVPEAGKWLNQEVLKLPTVTALDCAS